MQLSKEENARKRICNGCLVQIENSVTQDYCLASRGFTLVTEFSIWTSQPLKIHLYSIKLQHDRQNCDSPSESLLGTHVILEVLQRQTYVILKQSSTNRKLQTHKMLLKWNLVTNRIKCFSLSINWTYLYFIFTAEIIYQNIKRMST